MANEVPLPTYETVLTEAIRSLAVDTGKVTTPAAVGSNILQDATKNWPVNIHRNRLVKIIRGAGAGQTMAIDGNMDKSLVLRQSCVVSLDTTSVYVIIDVDFAQVLRDVLGGGANISAANPLQVYDPAKVNLLPFWSDPAAKITITNVGADINFPDIVVAGLPAPPTIRRVVLAFLCGTINDISGVDNYINAANRTLRIKKAAGAWATAIVGLVFANQSLYTFASTTRGGIPIFGDIDIKAMVDSNGTYNIRSDQTTFGDPIIALNASLELYDVQVGFLVFYS